MLVTMGLPIFFLELVLGQYCGQGPTEAFRRMAPIFHGLGYCTIVVIAFVTIYYMVIVSWTLFYLFASFSPNLAWAHCNNDFNTDSKHTDISKKSLNSALQLAFKFQFEHVKCIINFNSIKSMDRVFSRINHYVTCFCCIDRFLCIVRLLQRHSRYGVSRKQQHDDLLP